MRIFHSSRFFLIDIARIFCALSVALHHFKSGSHDQVPWQTFNFGSFAPTWSTNPLLFQWAEYGYLGVDIFFFLSGVVIVKCSAGRSPSEFLLSRFKRLYFPYLIVFIPTAIIYFFYSPVPISIESIILDLTFSAQFSGFSPVVAVTWTLVIEVIFYLIIAFVLLLQNILSRVKIEADLENFLLVWLLASWVFNLEKLPPPLNWFNLNGYLILFLAGSISY
jgi:peptidoglycan/LPS O-acetylase OafA/YrhL